LFLYFLNSIDATLADGCGKFVNDSWVGRNCNIKPVYVQNKLHLCLFVNNDCRIKKFTELRYSYDDSGKDLFWRGVRLLLLLTLLTKYDSV